MVTIKDGMVEFSFFRPQAREMHLVGDFNGWRERELSMTRDTDGYWRAAVRLPVGDFKFRYRADGRWFTDFAAFGVEHGPFGWDSILRVPTAAARRVRRSRPVKVQPALRLMHSPVSAA